MKRWLVLGLMCALVLTPGASAATDSSKLRDHMKLSKMVKHLEAFQQIADANGGTRASGTPGHEASVEYVAAKLRDKGFLVTAGLTMHPTYHTAADRLNTVNMKFLDDLSDAGAHAILWFAMDGQ